MFSSHSSRHWGSRIVVAACISLAAGPALATNGYFLHGYGAKNKGMAGAGAAFAQDALASATNPATLVDVPRRLDFGVDFFMPNRGATIRGNFFGPDEDYDGDGEKLYYIPDFGYAHPINEQWVAGIAVYGAGGMNTTYRNNPFARFGSSGDAGVDLIQLYVAPTIAYRISDTPSLEQSVGLSMNVVHQRFEALGLQAFAGKTAPGPYSESPDNVTNRGYDDSTGVGARLGYQARLWNLVSVGAAWQPKIRMGRFDKYSGLFAGQGGFDIPGTYVLGGALQVNERLTVAADYQRIEYSQVPSIGNSMRNLQNPDSPDSQVINAVPAEGAGSLQDILSGLQAGQTLLATTATLAASPLGPYLASLSGPVAEQRYGNQLGSTNGPGFGWRDMNVYKLGLNYQLNQQLTVRAGFSDNQQPVPADETFFNILAPGVVRKHYTVGATYSIGSHEITMHYLDAPEVVVKGQNSIPDAALPLPPQSFGGGEADIRLKEKTVGIAYGYRF